MVRIELCSPRFFGTAAPSGVDLFAYGRDVDGVRCARIVQVAYADDWAGIFRTERQLVKAWEVWRTWVHISGCKIGIKKALKTVVTVTLPGLLLLQQCKREECQYSLESHSRHQEKSPVLREIIVYL